MQHGILRERVFGCDLGERLALTGRDTPLVLDLCATVVEEHGVVDGIYRLSGIVSNLQKLRYVLLIFNTIAYCKCYHAFPAKLIQRRLGFAEARILTTKDGG